jgi:hypothetical protein
LGKGCGYWQACISGGWMSMLVTTFPHPTPSTALLEYTVRNQEKPLKVQDEIKVDNGVVIHMSG